MKCGSPWSCGSRARTNRPLTAVGCSGPPCGLVSLVPAHPPGHALLGPHPAVLPAPPRLPRPVRLVRPVRRVRWSASSPAVCSDPVCPGPARRLLMSLFRPARADAAASRGPGIPVRWSLVVGGLQSPSLVSGDDENMLRLNGFNTYFVHRGGAHDCSRLHFVNFVCIKQNHPHCKIYQTYPYAYM